MKETPTLSKLTHLTYMVLGFCVAMTALFQSCANPVPPAGGDKDTLAPVLLSVESALKSNRNHITLQFDENISTAGTLVYSPKIKTSNTPSTSTVKTQRNTIHVDVPAITNCIYLDNWVVDLNEKNPLKNSSLLLNGDSGEVIIKLKSSNSTKSKFGVYIFRDSLIYYPKSNKNNIYHFQGLPSGIYETVIIENDNNQKIENNESYNVFFSVNRPNDTLFVALYPPKKAYKSAYLLSQTKYPYCLIGSPISHEWLSLSDSLYLNQDTLLFSSTISKRLQLDLSIDSFITSNRFIHQTEKKLYGILDKDTLTSRLGLYGFNTSNYSSTYHTSKGDTVKHTFITLSKNTIQNNTDSTVYIRVFNNQINYILKLSKLQQTQIILPEGLYSWVSWIHSNPKNNDLSQPLNIDGSDLFVSDINTQQESFYSSPKPWIVKKNLENTLILPELSLYNTGITTK
ncbi:MAG: hypothetical protein ACKOXR_00780 [Bacteroidota bacterium]